MDLKNTLLLFEFNIKIDILGYHYNLNEIWSLYLIIRNAFQSTYSYSVV